MTETLLGASRVRQLEDNLRALPGLYQESLHHVAPISRRTHHTRVSGSRSTERLNMSALDARHNILAVLESWSSFVVDGLGQAAPTRSVPDLTRFLLRNAEWLTEQPPAPDFADEIDGLRRELLRTIDPERGEPRAPVWECVVADCAGKISAPSQSVGTTGATRIRCSSGHAWDMHEWITLRPLVERRRKAVGT
ncbi:hypothetical protein [Streptomyces reniochalinae]|uniref:OvmZ protein n=1 Tax=Streptomyces reniochalinae TaxID=2250578 RepID=A0A367EHH5_9ACTN|nr:hypothetical protein [Streptomyces reniochalinae]RCG17548.1 hypothetical protein DQ392_16935 [Streptomyces reniochalinae]